MLMKWSGIDVFKHQAKRMDSGAILLIITTFVGALIILIIEQTNKNIANQTNKL